MVRTFAAELQARITLLAGFIGIIWLVELVDLFLLRGALDAAGIRPRDPDALWGIVWAPFLHGGLPHLIANTVPLLVLGWLVLLRRRADFLVVTALVIVVGGLGVWLFGRPQTIHIGASGVVFGYLGYLFLRAWFERSPTAMLLALVAGVLYGGALWGVLPGQRGISWEGHLFGFAAGGVTARLVTTPPNPSRLGSGRPTGYSSG
jgi:membrane associated rhomboid family serine protease